MIASTPAFISSVVIDANHEPFEENVDITKRVIDAKQRVSVCCATGSRRFELGILHLP